MRTKGTNSAGKSTPWVEKGTYIHALLEVIASNEYYATYLDARRITFSGTTWIAKGHNTAEVYVLETIAGLFIY